MKGKECRALGNSDFKKIIEQEILYFSKLYS